MRPLHIMAGLGLCWFLAHPLQADTSGKANIKAYLNARMAVDQNDFTAAARFFDDALKAGPKDPFLLNGAAFNAMALGDFAKAARHAQTVLDQGDTTHTPYFPLITLDAKQGNYPKLAESLSKNEMISPLFDRLVLAWAYVGMGRMDEAIALFDRIAATRGQEFFGTYHKALALATVGDFEGASKTLSNPKAIPLRGIRRAVFAHAQILSQLERNQEAITLIDGVFVPGQDPEAEKMRAKLAAGKTLPFDVIADARQGMAEIYYTIALAIEGNEGDLDTLYYSRAATYLRPDLVDATLLSAKLLNNLGQRDMAIEAYNSVPPASPDYYLAELGRAASLENAGKIDSALEVLQTIFKTHPTIFSVQIAYGQTLRRHEKFADAIKLYDQALEQRTQEQPQNWLLFFNRGISHERLKNWDKAEADFRQALKLSPNQPEVLNYLGYGLLEQNKNLDEAFDLIKRATMLSPGSGHILDSLAWGYFRLGRYNEAVEPMERATQLEAADPIVNDHLGDIYWAVGRQMEARFQWRRALSFKPDEAEAKRIRAKIDLGLDQVLKDEKAPPLKISDSHDQTP